MSVVLQTQQDDSYEPSQNEIEEYGKWLGMSLPGDEHLLWIAREGLKAPLPENWKACKSEKGELYYFNFKSGQSIWDHPMDEYYKDLFKREKENRQQNADQDGHIFVELRKEEEHEAEMVVSTMPSTSSEDTDNDTEATEPTMCGASEQLCGSKAILNAKRRKISLGELPGINELPRTSKIEGKMGAPESGNVEQRKTNAVPKVESTQFSNTHDQILPVTLEIHDGGAAAENSVSGFQQNASISKPAQTASQETDEQSDAHIASSTKKPESILKPSSLKGKAALRVTFSQEVEDSSGRKSREKHESNGTASQHKKDETISARKEVIRANLERELALFKLSETDRYEKLKSQYVSGLEQESVKSQRALSTVFARTLEVFHREQNERASIEASQYDEFHNLWSARAHEFHVLACSAIATEIDANAYSQIVETKRSVARSIEEDLRTWRAETADALESAHDDGTTMQTAIHEATLELRASVSTSVHGLIEETYNTFAADVEDTYRRAHETLTSVNSQLSAHVLDVLAARTRIQISRELEEIRSEGERQKEEEREKCLEELKKLKTQHECVIADERLRLSEELKRTSTETCVSSPPPCLDDMLFLASSQPPQQESIDKGPAELDVSGKVSIGTGQLSVTGTDLPSVSPTSPAEGGAPLSSYSQSATSISTNEASCDLNNAPSVKEHDVQVRDQRTSSRLNLDGKDFSEGAAHEQRGKLTRPTSYAGALKRADLDSCASSCGDVQVARAVAPKATTEVVDVSVPVRGNSQPSQSSQPFFGVSDPAHGEFKSAVAAVVIELLRGVPLPSQSAQKPAVEGDSFSAAEVSYTAERREACGLPSPGKACHGAIRTAPQMSQGDRHHTELHQQRGEANGPVATPLKSCVRFASQLRYSDGPLAQHRCVNTAPGGAKHVPISSSLADQESMVEAEAERLCATKEFLVSQRGFLEECKVRLKQVRHQWKEDVLAAKREGVDANSRRGQALHKRRESLDKQMAEYLEDDAVLRDTELWLEAKEKRLQSLRAEIARQEAILLANGDMSACSIETATLVSNYFCSHAPDDEYVHSGVKSKPHNTVPPAKTTMNPRLSKTLDRIERRLKEVTNMIHTTQSHGSKRVTSARSPETRRKSRGIHATTATTLIPDVAPRHLESPQLLSSSQPGKHIRFVDPWKAELR